MHINVVQLKAVVTFVSFHRFISFDYEQNPIILHHVWYRYIVNVWKRCTILSFSKVHITSLFNL